MHGLLDLPDSDYPYKFLDNLFLKIPVQWLVIFLEFFGTRDLFNISYSRELYLFSKFLHFEEIVPVKIAVHFEIIVIEAYTTF